MKRTLLTLFIALCAFTVKAQSDTIANKIYLATDKAPEFPGGLKEFATFLAKNIRYPVKSRTRGKQGRVLVTFVIEKDGQITNSKVIRPTVDDLDAEALRVVNLSPKWNPGIVNGEPVRTQFTYPINFVLPMSKALTFFGSN
ncbi:energy transducer TonB [Mucilaginibacter auburnensis]|uniref:TonB family protein n=1 Tax=Mucilaginibacter auburnensis TaxID=1457233 RepID=A0A2H9VVK6_9SPHI|nr:energy transducer TonB [Mucilaginibacter auburnensis]PJJ84819.1 TonB family protein [Mucilaginibacter auburnensis]